MDQLISEIINRANQYLTALPDRRVSPAPDSIAGLKQLDVPLQDLPINPAAVLAELDDIGSKATVACAGGRYFGFVTGGALPATMAANMLAAVWDQNAVLETASPVASFIEEVCRKWLVSVLGLPPQTTIGFATGATMANFSGLAAARHALLEQQGWDVESRGLFGAPAIEVIVGEEVHVSLLKALSMLGLGRDRVVRIPVDEQGRMRAELIPPIDGPAIICIQAGNVNTGAFDPAQEICLNDVVLNQVLVKFGDEKQTRRVIRRIQTEGTCWCGETKWQGHVAMRISVSSWATTGEDVEKSLAAILRIAAQITRRP